MMNYSMNYNTGELRNNSQQFAGSVQNGQVYGTNGLQTTNYMSSGVIRDAYHNVVGTVTPQYIPPRMSTHP